MGNLRQLTDITEAVIHCSDTPNGRPDLAEDIDRWHAGPQFGFKRDLTLAPHHQPELKHIGYHAVIEVDGRIVAGRPFIETGAHCPQNGMNQNGVAVCLIGRDGFTRAQWQSLAHLYSTLQQYLPNLQRISGHNDHNPGKTCPGFNVNTWLSSGQIPSDAQVIDLHGGQ
ncbi:Uncharacterised protein [BD1-7 clade bacterium]|uniref:N-acetylmuramoyl-L-alanine amidase domain-containing protein n=1 Tax=BD1-7 clade bacterium TaxID=2029982 RepID=A0A5S9Q251_9GAMM|nr:Uncharacterised protein [BD1-7 clade bacterium]CAA0111761.1 Uncharacterised protein [BD1-7 clade bacterium]